MLAYEIWYWKSAETYTISKIYYKTSRHLRAVNDHSQVALLCTPTKHFKFPHRAYLQKSSKILSAIMNMVSEQQKHNAESWIWLNIKWEIYIF